MIATTAGYAGGTTAAPNYWQRGDHSEAVAITFDPQRLDYAQLLAHFWQLHDPTDPYTKAGYRTAVLTLDERQHAIALASRGHLADRLEARVHTPVERIASFWPAEVLHQKFYARRHRALWAAAGGLFPSDYAFASSTLAARLNAWAGRSSDLPTLARQLDELMLPAGVAERLLAEASR